MKKTNFMMKLATELLTKPEFKASQRINVTRRHKVLNNYMVCPETNPSDFPLNLPSGPPWNPPPCGIASPFFFTAIY